MAGLDGRAKHVRKMATLGEIVRALVADGKGVLVADETVPSLTKRFAARAIQSTPDGRRDYREMFFRTPGISEFIGGAIMHAEAIRQRSSGGAGRWEERPQP